MNKPQHKLRQLKLEVTFYSTKCIHWSFKTYCKGNMNLNTVEYVVLINSTTGKAARPFRCGTGGDPPPPLKPTKVTLS